MGIRTRLIAAAMAVATLTAVVGVATASAAPASPTASASQQPAPGDKKEPAKEAKKPGPGVPADAIKLLAHELHISTDRAKQVFADLEKVKGKDVLKDPAFIAIAKGLGITPQRLLDALIAVKKAFAAKEDKGDKGGKGGKGGKTPSGTPTK